MTNHYLQFSNSCRRHIQRRRQSHARMQSISIYICQIQKQNKQISIPNQQLNNQIKITQS